MTDTSPRELEVNGSDFHHHYFVSYFMSGPAPGQFGFGNDMITLREPIRSKADLDVARDLIKQESPPGIQIAILNFQRFERDPEKGGESDG